MTAGLIWSLVPCSKCGEAKCPPQRPESKRKPICMDCKGPVVMRVGLPDYGKTVDIWQEVKIHLGARTTQSALDELRAHDVLVFATGQMHRLAIIANWRDKRHFVLETLLNANSNSLQPGGWSWELRERVFLRDRSTSTRVQLFEAPPATEKYGIYADPGVDYPHYL